MTYSVCGFKDRKETNVEKHFLKEMSLRNCFQVSKSHHLIAECQRQEIPVIERTYTVDELWDADEVLVTSASALCVPVVELDGSPIGGKAPSTVRALQDALLKEYLEATE